MFWPIVLPFKITTLLFAVILLIANFRVRRCYFAAISIFISLVLFVPAMIAVELVVDLYRFGKFEYASGSALKNDRYVWLPNDSQDITVYRSFHGFHAKFSISTVSLKTWVEEMRSRHPELNDPGPEWWDPIAAGTPRKEDVVFFEDHFPQTGWQPVAGMGVYDVCLSDDGAGFKVWHRPGSDVAYLVAGYR